LSSACDADLCIIGGGTIGVVIARDTASCGHTSIVLEKESVIGGVWAKNDYPGLRLQITGAAYRCLSLAPAWARYGKGRDDVRYRPTGKEVLSYIHDMADHDLIDVVHSHGSRTHDLRATCQPHHCTERHVFDVCVGSSRVRPICIIADRAAASSSAPVEGLSMCVPSSLRKEHMRPQQARRTGPSTHRRSLTAPLSCTRLVWVMEVNSTERVGGL
jgi:hypothetical protein